MYESEQRKSVESRADSKATPATPEAVKPRPRIYVASLSDYNAGRLHGVWLDAAREVEELQAGVTAMLESSPEPIAEEWAIHDYEGFGTLRLGEYEGLGTIGAVARGIVEHGPAFAAWADLQHPLSAASLEGFEEAYRGSWASVEAYAENLLDDLGATAELEEISDWLQSYVRLDTAAFARDLELGGDIVAIKDEAEVHIFDVNV